MGAFTAPHVDPDRDVRQPAEEDDEDVDRNEDRDNEWEPYPLRD